jgi:hypothetical protein
MKHSSGLRLTLSGAAAAAVSAGQEVELQLRLVQLRHAGEDLDRRRPLGLWPIRARTTTDGLEVLHPAVIDVITDDRPGGHPCNEVFILQLHQGDRLVLEIELWDAQSGMRARIVESDGWRPVEGERPATFVGPLGLRLCCEGLHVLID